MAKATIVKVARITERGTIVCTTSGRFFLLNSFDELGVLRIEATIPLDGMTINEFAEIVAGCFKTRSSFRGVAWIYFTYDGVTADVAKGEAFNNSIEYIVNKWKKAQEAKNK